MPQAKFKRETEYNTSPTKSAFLYGTPNKRKLAVLKEIQSEYTQAVQAFIELLVGNNDLLVDIIKNDYKSPASRAFEAAHRWKILKSALSQNAFDEAFKMLSNRLDNIRLECYYLKRDVLTGSKVLFAMTVQGRSRDDMVKAFQEIIQNKKDEALRKGTKPQLKFYEEGILELQAMTEETFSARVLEIVDQYWSFSLLFKVPHPEKMEVKLDGRVQNISRAEHVNADYVIEIIDIHEHGKRFAVPLTTSTKSVYRLENLKKAKTVYYTIRDDDTIRVTYSFSKSAPKPVTTTSKGVDTGIIDCFYVSDGTHFGSMSDVIEYYQEVVEKSFAGLSELRNKKRRIEHYLHQDREKPLPDDVRQEALGKIDRLQQMIDLAKEPYHKQRHYYAMLDHEIAQSVEAYIQDTPENVMTILEKLDIKEFNKSHKSNGMMSTFARGKLQKRLMEQLNWNGRDFLEVEPAYTSQLCPVCSHVEKANRNGKVFKCKCCGYTDDADHNASVNINARASDKEILDLCDAYHNPTVLHAKLKEVYKGRNAAWLEKTKNIADEISKTNGVKSVA